MLDIPDEVRNKVIAEGNVADLVVLDRAFRVVRTFIDGEEVFSRA